MTAWRKKGGIKRVKIAKKTKVKTNSNCGRGRYQNAQYIALNETEKYLFRDDTAPRDIRAELTFSAVWVCGGRGLGLEQVLGLAPSMLGGLQSGP